LRTPHACRPCPSWLVASLLALGLAACQGEHEKALHEFETASRPELRAGALARLAEMSQEEDFHLFLKATRDPSALVRKSAVMGLGKSGDAKAIDTLGELLGDPDYDVETEAAVGLARFNTDKARAYLLSAYGRRDGPARAAIAKALGAEGLKEAIRHEAKILWDRNQKALEAGGPAERVGAAEEIGRSGRGDAVERLLPILGDDSVLLAAGAARGLGAARDKRAVTALMGVFKENLPVLREAAADSLGLLGDPSAVPVLEKTALEGGSGSTQAINAIGQLAFAPEGKASLCKLASEGNLDVARFAARLAKLHGGCSTDPIVARLAKNSAEPFAALAALEGLGGSAGVEKVAALLDSPDRAVKIAAAQTLGAMEAPEAVGGKIVKMLEAEAERLAVAQAKWVNEKLPSKLPERERREREREREHDGDDATSRQLRERSQKFNDMMAKVDALNEQRAQALGIKLVDRETPAEIDLVDDLAAGDGDFLFALALAAGRLKVPAALPVLEKLTKDAHATTRGAACEALGAVATGPALDLVGRCIEDPDRGVLRAAARGLRRAGPAGGGLLVSALKRRSSERWEFVQAIGELKAKEAAPKVAELLGAGGAEAVEAAVALGKLGDPAFAKVLAEQLKDHTHPARLEIIAALAELGDPSVSGVLVPQLFNERPEVRAITARALAKLDRKAAGPMLEALRFDYYAEVRRAVEEALGASPANAQGAR
jgi:HEAT repeat protein